MELAQIVAAVTGFTGQIVTDPTKPDGTMRKLMDVNRLSRLGWTARISLHDGIQSTYDWYRAQRAAGQPLRKK
jgi:nucleoside-diphosphate-sugar epimerase